MLKFKKLFKKYDVDIEVINIYGYYIHGIDPTGFWFVNHIGYKTDKYDFMYSYSETQYQSNGFWFKRESDEHNNIIYEVNSIDGIVIDNRNK